MLKCRAIFAGLIHAVTGFDTRDVLQLAGAGGRDQHALDLHASTLRYFRYSVSAFVE